MDKMKLKITDKDRLDFIVNFLVDYKNAGYDGCEYGRYDLIWRNDNPDFISAIDAEILKNRT